MKYAVFEVSGNQYKAEEGEEIWVQGMKADGESASVDKVLLISDGEEVRVGTPYIDKARVEVKILGEEKGEKVRILKFRAKSRYRRRAGFRPKYTRIKVEQIAS